MCCDTNGVNSANSDSLSPPWVSWHAQAIQLRLGCDCWILRWILGTAKTKKPKPRRASPLRSPTGGTDTRKPFFCSTPLVTTLVKGSKAVLATSVFGWTATLVKEQPEKASAWIEIKLSCTVKRVKELQFLKAFASIRWTVLRGELGVCQKCQDKMHRQQKYTKHIKTLQLMFNPLTACFDWQFLFPTKSWAHRHFPKRSNLQRIVPGSWAKLLGYRFSARICIQQRLPLQYKSPCSEWRQKSKKCNPERLWPR